MPITVCTLCRERDELGGRQALFDFLMGRSLGGFDPRKRPQPALGQGHKASAGDRGLPLYIKQKLLALGPLPQWLHSLLDLHESEFDIEWDSEVAVAELVKQCQEWCKAAGLKPPTPTQFGIELKSWSPPELRKGRSHCRAMGRKTFYLLPSPGAWRSFFANKLDADPILLWPDLGGTAAQAHRDSDSTQGGQPEPRPSRPPPEGPRMIFTPNAQFQAPQQHQPTGGPGNVGFDAEIPSFSDNESEAESWAGFGMAKFGSDAGCEPMDFDLDAELELEEQLQAEEALMAMQL